MSKFVKAKQKRAKWLILFVFLLSFGTILPLSWNAIQAQRAQQHTMKAMKKSIAEIASALQMQQCNRAVLTPINALLTQARKINAVFPKLSQAPGDFAKLSRSMVQQSEEFGALAQAGSCKELNVRFPELKKSCAACHELFHPQPTIKFE